LFKRHYASKTSERRLEYKKNENNYKVIATIIFLIFIALWIIWCIYKGGLRPGKRPLDFLKFNSTFLQLQMRMRKAPKSHIIRSCPVECQPLESFNFVPQQTWEEWRPQTIYGTNAQVSGSYRDVLSQFKPASPQVIQQSDSQKSSGIDIKTSSQNKNSRPQSQTLRPGESSFLYGWKLQDLFHGLVPNSSDQNRPF
jgi:hypothetical protein